jgi:NAD-dependent deacetylase
MSKSIFFILGAGASTDSNLPTYRGDGGFYENTSIKPENVLTYTPLQQNPKTVWDFITPLYQKIQQSRPGPTYDKLKEIP